ncbi:carboxypeptidase-like regulatory domain-containing protein [Pseudogemmatithrix spongiicola]|uniref:Carboxypeptidase-like regulatory domain-containing protein n=1 Tax=Pseudogemmatithrix spongiicola TaxID=3062599 RepID=A0AA49JYR1_9BACT|nr:carboxypeptidase-like regulatory domain-containing protein [Gemmatimonadaceae bacterium 'strain 138']WKW14318.1 carboxypeptidase-like regulatory domain-containing protein [Gemmatimonadaceae bacterium 'strain 318']
MRLLILALLMLSSTAAHAQGSIRGVLLDSLRAMGPLAGADVVLMPGGRRARTDDRGRFAFDDVPAGAYRVTYAALWLDSVGVAPASAGLDVGTRGSAAVTVLTGTRAALALQRCGGAMDVGRGLVVGELRDVSAVPLAGAIVVARWSELVVGGAPDADPQEYAAVDTTGADGRYALCGMPDNAEVVVGARHPDGRSTGAVVLVVNPGVLAHDLVIGAPSRVVRLRGRVTNGNGAPVTRAEILASASRSGVQRTDSTGRFELQLEEGSRQVVIRALGFQPRLLDVRAGESMTEIGDVALQPASAVLDTMVIRAAPLTVQELEFEQRRRTQIGAFLDEQTLRKLPRATVNAVAGMSAPWVRAANGRLLFRGLASIYGGVECKPRLFVDGSDWGNRTPDNEIESLLQFARRIEMYRAANAPPEFNDFDGCGSLVLWII